MTAHDVRDGVGLGHGRIRKEFRLRCVARPLDADARCDIVFDGVRIADGFKVENGLVDGAGKSEIAFVDDQILPVGFESTVNQLDRAGQAQVLIVLCNRDVALQFAL